MHLLHLSAHGHSNPPAGAAHLALMDATNPESIPMAHDLSSGSIPSQAAQPVPMQAIQHPVAPEITNPPYTQSTASNPPILSISAQASSETSQLPTPEAMIDQSELLLFPHAPLLVTTLYESITSCHWFMYILASTITSS